jgi:hypothetical protein
LIRLTVFKNRLSLRHNPIAVMSRSIAINMRRSPDQLKLFDETDRAFIVKREAIQKWAARCTLSREPEMPAGFQGRTADNWRPLLAIADDFGVDYGEAARAAAVVSVQIESTRTRTAKMSSSTCCTMPTRASAGCGSRRSAGGRC